MKNHSQEPAPQGLPEAGARLAAVWRPVAGLEEKLFK